jgi:hypothetical protein
MLALVPAHLFNVLMTVAVFFRVGNVNVLEMKVSEVKRKLLLVDSGHPTFGHYSRNKSDIATGRTCCDGHPVCVSVDTSSGHSSARCSKYVRAFA